MSRSIILVKFKDDTILWGTYYSTTSTLGPWLITKEELVKKYDNDVFNYCDLKDKEYDERHYPNHGFYPLESKNEVINDAEDVEIFIEYGGGSCLKGKASKSRGLILSDLNEERYWPNGELDEISQWVFDYYDKIRRDSRYLTR